MRSLKLTTFETEVLPPPPNGGNWSTRAMARLVLSSQPSSGPYTMDDQTQGVLLLQAMRSAEEAGKDDVLLEDTQYDLLLRASLGFGSRVIDPAIAGFHAVVTTAQKVDLNASTAPAA